jgi:hypothetical protein
MRVIAAINVLLWGTFIWIGHGLLDDLVKRSVPGFPNQGQMTYYLYFPIGMLGLTLSGYVLSRVRKLRYLGLGVEILLLVLFVPFFLGYPGGV